MAGSDVCHFCFPDPSSPRGGTCKNSFSLNGQREHWHIPRRPALFIFAAIRQSQKVRRHFEKITRRMLEG
jgi:hypothetical protein